MALIALVNKWAIDTSSYLAFEMHFDMDIIVAIASFTSFIASSS